MQDKKGLKVMSETDQIINRHMARLLSELEEAYCPAVYLQAVKSKLAWLRTDLNELKGTKDNDNSHS